MTERGKGSIKHIFKSTTVTKVGSGHSRKETVLKRLRLGQCVLKKTLKLVGKQACMRDAKVFLK